MHNVAVLDRKWWLGAFWLSGNKLLVPSGMSIVLRKAQANMQTQKSGAGAYIYAIISERFWYRALDGAILN